MKCNKNKVPMVRLGDYIVQRREKNDNYNVPIRGVARYGFIDLKQENADTSLYNVFYKYDFVFNPARMELNSISLNTEIEKGICSSLYEIFYVKDITKLLPEYLNLFFKRDEFARFCWFDAIGSARNYYRVSNMQNILIPLPDIEVQKSVVAAYKGLKNLIETNEALIEPLQNACNAYVVDLKKKYPMKALGPYIQECDERNRDGLNLDFCGINKDKTFIPSVADTDGLDNSKYKVVKKGIFVFSGMQTGRDICIRIALYEEEKTCLVSPAYTTFFVNKQNEILSEYLFLYFKRYEMDRYGAFLSDGSIRSNLDWNRFLEIKIPLPPIEIQKAIVAVYKGLAEAKRIASEAKEELKKICPALVQLAAHSA